MVDICVYISQARVYPILQSDVFSPIYTVSISKEDEKLNTGRENEGIQFPEWGRVATLYNVWKQTNHDMTGWMQEARYLSFAEGKRDDGSIARFSKPFCHYYGWTKKSVYSFSRKYDLVLPCIYPVHELSVLNDVKTPYDFYLSEGGTASEINLMLGLIRERYPEKYIHALKFLHGTEMMPWHLFVMKKQLFQAHGKFLFDVLFEMRAQMPMAGRIGFQRQNWEFLAEILWNIDMNSLYATHKEIKVKRSPIVYIDDQDYTLSRRDIVARITAHENNVKQYLSTRILFGGKINIVISFDDHYVKPAYATINSVLQHTTSCKEITFYVIHDEKLSEKTRNEIRKTYKNKVSIEFLSVGESFINDFPLNRSHVNVNTYYRLLIHKLLGKDIERVIYLDTDIILCEDIVDLWNVDLNHHIIGAVGDESGRVGEWRLFKTQGKTPYINAGVFVFDLKRARERYQNLDFLYADIFYNNIESVIMQDQDILNIAYKNDIYLISLSWNVPSSFYCRKGSHSDGGYEGIEHMFSRKEREEAIKKPKIIHFTGRQKPWKLSCNHPLKALYWQAYEQTEGASFSLRDRVCLWNNYLSVKKNRVLIQTNNKLIEIPFGV